ncbi:MAG: hypothetical protein GSR72_07280 [Desulfurococcales archaeon]|nr:hypothetical protein [Desulfurococcales archaeon]MEB3789676.1 hypothetical protein [Desulfurococcales archaeon]
MTSQIVKGVDQAPKCPICKVPMMYLMEKEKKSSGEIRITRFYRCPVCGTKIIDERLLLKPVNGSIVVYSLSNGERQIIYSRPRPVVKRGRKQVRTRARK